MASLRTERASSIVGLVVANLATPVHADDQALQAVLLKFQCVASKVVATGLAPGIVAYEISCRGRTETLRILCHGADCLQQARPREEDEDLGTTR